MGDTVLRFVLAVTATSAFVALIFVLVIVEPPANVPFRDVLLVLVGTMVGLVKDVFGFFFGSSSGSKDANDAMKNIAVRAAADGTGNGKSAPAAPPVP